jgi:excisionase family DNA binding protein
MNKATDQAAPMALRVSDACRTLSISRSHLYALAAKGGVKLTRVGGRTLVTMAEINRLLGAAEGGR